MGMDVIGKNQQSETGKYFRASVWSWHPLWDYCCDVAPNITQHVKHGHTNDGSGLNAKRSSALAAALRDEIASGRCAAYVAARNAALDALPRVPCKHCNATGVRTDKVGMDMGHDKRRIIGPVYGGPEDATVQLSGGFELVMAQPKTAVARHPRYGQVGWCNACNGVGTVADFKTNYRIEVDFVQEFAAFLEQCGGFEIH